MMTRNITKMKLLITHTMILLIKSIAGVQQVKSKDDSMSSMGNSSSLRSHLPDDLFFYFCFISLVLLGLFLRTLGPYSISHHTGTGKRVLSLSQRGFSGFGKSLWESDRVGNQHPSGKLWEGALGI